LPSVIQAPLSGRGAATRRGRGSRGGGPAAGRGWPLREKWGAVGREVQERTTGVGNVLRVGGKEEKKSEPIPLTDGSG
jgi:hypothetical protein